MKSIFSILLILSLASLLGQPPEIEWQKSLGGSGVDFALSIQQTSDGGYIVAGYSESTDGDITGNHGSYDFWIVKLDPAGDLLWQKSLGGLGIDLAESIQQTSDGGYIVAGRSESNDDDVTGNHGSADFWIVKLDSDGDLIWQKPGCDAVRCLAFQNVGVESDSFV